MNRPLLLGCALLAATLAAAACSSSGGGTSTLTVQGKVIFFRSSQMPDLGLPHPGVTVLTSGLSPVVTDSSGSFTLAGVRPPYNLTLIDSPNQTGLVVVGLTRANPVLAFEFASQPRQMLVDGQVTGLTAGAGTVELTATGPDALLGLITPNQTSGLFTGSPINWGGPSTATTTTATLWALQYTGSTLSGVQAMGTLTLSAVDGSHPTGVAIAMSPVTPAPFPVTVSGFPAASSGGLSVVLMQAGRPAAQIGGLTITSSATFSPSIPPVPAGLTYQVTAYGDHPNPFTSNQTTTWGVTGAGATVQLHTPLQLLSPSNGAIGVGLATPFSWMPESAPALYQVTISPNASGLPTLQILTAATTVTIPDLRVQGLVLPTTTACSWSVSAIGPYSSIDALAADGGVPPATGSTFLDGASRGFTSR